MKTMVKGPQGRRGFTMVEMVVVVGIIMILAGVTVAVGVALKRKGADALTRTTLKSLDGAMGELLKSSPEPNDLNWYRALQSLPDGAKVLKAQGPRNTGSAVLDGYGSPIHYIPSAPPTKPMGYFWSYGSDGVPSTADDVFSDGTGT
jgi:general secretion pathway protein G